MLRLAGSDTTRLDLVLPSAGTAHVVFTSARESFHGLTETWRGTGAAAAAIVGGYEPQGGHLDCGPGRHAQWADGAYLGGGVRADRGTGQFRRRGE